MSNRGQIFSADAIFAIFVIVALLLISFVVYNQVYSEMEKSRERAQLSEAASLAAQQLVLSAGKPTNWENNSNLSLIHAIGLASKQNVLEWDKVKKFFEMSNSSANYSDMKALLGIDRPNYNYSVNISYANGTTINTTELNTSAQNITAQVERVALLNNSAVRVRVTVWIGGEYYGFA